MSKGWRKLGCGRTRVADPKGSALDVFALDRDDEGRTEEQKCSGERDRERDGPEWPPGTPLRRLSPNGAMPIGMLTSGSTMKTMSPGCPRALVRVGCS